MTVQKISIDIDLFKAALEDASDAEDAGLCVICREKKSPVFVLDIGADIIVACEKCANKQALDANDRKDGTCDTCATSLPFPYVHEEIRACLTCLQEERAAITKDTEHGMVRWEDAQRGLTHGLPAPSAADQYRYEYVDHSDGSGWRKVLNPAPTRRDGFEIIPPDTDGAWLKIKKPIGTLKKTSRRPDLQHHPGRNLAVLLPGTDDVHRPT